VGVKEDDWRDRKDTRVPDSYRKEDEDTDADANALISTRAPYGREKGMELQWRKPRTNKCHNIGVCSTLLLPRFALLPQGCYHIHIALWMTLHLGSVVQSKKSLKRREEHTVN
jgi:hypothetical protein